MIPQVHRLEEQTFGAKMATSENFDFTCTELKKKVFHSPVSSILTAER